MFINKKLYCFMEKDMDNRCNENLIKALELTEQMLILADEGDDSRSDVGCGVLYGMMRDCGYKLRLLVEREIEQHQKVGKWHEPKTVYQFPRVKQSG